MTFPDWQETRQDKSVNWINRLVICVLILLVGLVAAVYIQKTRPRARKKIPEKIVPIVTVAKVAPVQEQMKITAVGTVVPAHETTLKSSVSGEVVYLHPSLIEGGYIHKGEVLLRIDPRDYKLKVAVQAGALVSAEYALKLELGRQEVARREWDLMQRKGPVSFANQELALRKPHLEKAEADLAAARAELARAELDLKRTSITAPYDAVIREKMVDLGTYVSVQGQLVKIIGVDEYRVQVALPVDKLPYIQIPGDSSGEGALVQVRYRGADFLPGKVIQVLGDLDPEGRMARLLVSISDPLQKKRPGIKQPPLLIDEFVHVEIQGPVYDAVYKVPASAIHDNRQIWVADTTNRLAVREVSILWRDGAFVFLKQGLQPGDRLILSQVSNPVPGMSIQTAVKQ